MIYRTCSTLTKDQIFFTHDGDNKETLTIEQGMDSYRLSIKKPQAVPRFKNSASKVPNGLKCITITRNSHNSASGWFRIQVEFSDWSHEIDHSTTLFDNHTYNICYNSKPQTLKLIVNEPGLAGGGSTGFLFDVDGQGLRGLKCVDPSATAPGCIIGHPNADVNNEAYKIRSK